VEAALALARGGDLATAEKLVDALNQEFPLDTLIENYWIPTVRAAIAFERHDSAKAIAILRASVPYELAAPPPFAAGTIISPQPGELSETIPRTMPECATSSRVRRPA